MKRDAMAGGLGGTPLLTQKHEKARLEFAETYLWKTQSFFRTMIFGKAHHSAVYQKTKKPLRKSVPTVKHGGASWS